MAIKSNNTKGNQYHDEATGEFTSADNVGQKQEKIENIQPSNISEKTTSTIETSKPTPTGKKIFKLKTNSNVEEVRSKLDTINQVASIPVLGSANDIEEHLEEYFPASVVKSIDEKFGKFSVPYKYYNLRTDPDQRCGVNIFAACIGKKRWKNNYIKLIDYKEYYQMSRDYYNYKQLYRGIRASSNYGFDTIADSYSSKENEMIYGSSGGTCYGIAVYATTYHSEAVSYAGGNGSHIMDLILNKNATTMSYRNICRIRDDISYRKNNLIAKAEQIFLKNGIEPSRANQMAKSFGITLGDEGFIAMLLGVEWYTDNGSYHMIENLGSLYRFRN